MAYRNIRVDVAESKIATLTINRPSVKNALDMETVDSAQAPSRPTAISACWSSPAPATPRSFPVRTSTTSAAAAATGLAAINSSLFAEWTISSADEIAAINGYALGGGCELALACDIGITSENAKFGQPRLGLGIIPGAGATQRLPRIVGLGWAERLVLTGDVIDATALEIGLVTAITPHRDVHEMAKRVLRQGTTCAGLAKMALNASARVSIWIRSDRDAGSGALLQLRGQGGRHATSLRNASRSSPDVNRSGPSRPTRRRVVVDGSRTIAR